MKCYGTIVGELPTGIEFVREGTLLRIYFDFERSEFVQMAGSDDMSIGEMYVCENVDVEGDLDYDNIVSAIIMERYDSNKRDAIFANLEVARDETSEIDEEKRSEYLKEYADYQSYRVKAKGIAKEVLSRLK